MEKTKINQKGRDLAIRFFKTEYIDGRKRDLFKWLLYETRDLKIVVSNPSTVYLLDGPYSN